MNYGQLFCFQSKNFKVGLYVLGIHSIKANFEEFAVIIIRKERKTKNAIKSIQN